MSEQQSRGDKYILRFEHAGHRDRIKHIAAAEKRSLNSQILTLIQAGESTPKLHDAIDQIGASAEQGLALLKIVSGIAPTDLSPLLVGIEELFRLIGFTADETDSTDANDRAGLREVWGMAQ
jgi:hypothetical protein